MYCPSSPRGQGWGSLGPPSSATEMITYTRVLTYTDDTTRMWSLSNCTQSCELFFYGSLKATSPLSLPDFGCLQMGVEWSSPEQEWHRLSVFHFVFRHFSVFTDSWVFFEVLSDCCMPLVDFHGADVVWTVWYYMKNMKRQKDRTLKDELPRSTTVGKNPLEEME